MVKSMQEINSRNNLLLASHVAAARDLIDEAFGGAIKVHGESAWIKWSRRMQNYEIGPPFSPASARARDRVDDVNGRMADVEILLSKLRSCPYTHHELRKVLQSLQALIDDMLMKAMQLTWVAELDGRVEDILATRLGRAW